MTTQQKSLEGHLGASSEEHVNYEADLEVGSLPLTQVRLRVPLKVAAKG
jgi:hypothetical protein